MSIKSIVFTALTFLTLGTGWVAAESVMWKENPPNVCIAGCRLRLQSMYAQVQYNVSVVNALTGVRIPSGTTVARGTRVSFKFAPLANTDVFWNGTGRGQDSPYGNFTPGAIDPNDYKYIGDIGRSGGIETYINFVVATPNRSISGLPAGCTTAADGASKTCTLSTPGTINAAFNIADTFGRWYGWYNKTIGLRPRIMTPNGSEGDYQRPVSVPPIPYTLIVSNEELPGKDPSQPNLAAGGGACVTGTPHSIMMNSTDPDGDQVRFLVDWDGNGFADQIMPASGFLPSGATQTATRTYALPGSKVVKVMAEDFVGRTSGWATFSFQCTGSVVSALIGDGSDDGTISEADGGTGTVQGPDLYIRATPSLVRVGATSQVHWGATRVTSCTVAGTNGDAWTGITSPLGGELTASIRGEVVYTLTCLDRSGGTQTKKAVVTIIPSFQEK